MPAANLKVLIGWKEIAAYLDCSRSTAVRRLENGLPVFRVGGSVRAFAADIDRWLEGERLRKMKDERQADAASAAIVVEDSEIVETVAGYVREGKGQRYAVVPLGADTSEYERIEDHLKKSEEKSRWVLETIPVWVWETDANNEFTYSNVASVDMLGYRPEELVGFKPSEFLVHQEDVPACENAFGRIRKKKDAVRNLRCRFVTRENDVRWFEVDAEPAFDARGKFAGVRGVSRDVTARVRAEDKEKEHLAILSFLTRTANDFVAFDPEGDLFAYVADKLRELVGDASVALTSYDEVMDSYKVRAVANLGAKTGAILKAFGKDPVGMIFPATGALKSGLLEGKLRKYEVSLNELTRGLISRRLDRKLQKILGFRGIYVMGIVRHGKLLGLASIIPPRGTRPGNPEVVEGFINQAAVAIQRKYAEEAFLKSEERYRTLFEGSPAAVTVLNPAGVIVEVNKATEQLTGYAAKELRGKRFADLLTLAPEDITKATAKYEALLRGDAGEPYDLEIIRKDGNKRWIRVRNSLSREGETIAGIQVISGDITDRKRAIEALEESEEKFRNLVERANDGIAIVIDGRLAYANPRISEATGYEAGQMLGEPFSKFIDPAELSKVTKYYKKRMRGEDVPTIYETAVRRADGSRMYVELNVGTFSYRGELAELVYIRDLTERKKAEETREREREAFKIIAEAAVHAKSIRALCRRVVTGLAKALRFEIGSIRLYEPETETLERTASYGMTRDEIDAYFPTQPLSDSRYFAAQAASTREPIFAPDVTKHDVARTLGPRIEELGLATIISWPILGAEDTLLGVVNLGSRSPKDIAEEDRAFFETVAGMFATVLERRRAEDEVRTSEAKHRLLLESIGSPVLALDKNMNILYYNDAYAACAEFPQQGMEGKYLLEVLPSFAETESYKAYEKALYTGAPQAAEGECCERYFRTAVYPMPWGILTVAADVTESKRTEEALRESEEKYRNIFEHSPAGIVVHQDGKVSFLSPAMLRMIGYDSAEEVIGKPIMEFVHPDYHERLAREIEVVLARGGKLAEPSELVILGKDGSPLSVTSIAQTITYKAAPAIQAYVVNNSERKRAEEALRESEERYRVLFEGGNDAVFVFNVTADGKPGKFVEVNNEACQYLGYSAAELHELTPADLVPPERRKAVAELMRRLVEERELIFEWAHLRKDGAEIPVEISSHLFEFRGEPTAISIVRDITERIRAEEALRKSEQEVRGAEREKTAILSSMSEHVVYHDKELKILWANEAASSSVGLSPEGLIGRHCYEVWHDRKQPCENCPVAAAIETGGPHEEEVTTPDGRSWFIRGYPIKDEGGDVTNAVEVTLEITDRKRAEDDLKHALAENEALLEAVPDLMFVVDKEGNYVDFKRVEADMFALPPETIIGKNVRDTGFTAEDERKVFAGIERTLRTGETTTVHYELEVPRGRGAFEARIVKLNDDEVLAVAREITPPGAPAGD
jgi:PAS domain S-box-containing protein